MTDEYKKKLAAEIRKRLRLPDTKVSDDRLVELTKGTLTSFLSSVAVLKADVLKELVKLWR